MKVEIDEEIRYTAKIIDKSFLLDIFPRYSSHLSDLKSKDFPFIHMDNKIIPNDIILHKITDAIKITANCINFINTLAKSELIHNISMIDERFM